MPNIINQERFIKESLDAHNLYRKQHGVQNVEHDSRLSELALDWAENLAKSGSLKYKNFTYQDQPLGENILRFNLKDARKFYFSGEYY